METTLTKEFLDSIPLPLTEENYKMLRKAGFRNWRNLASEELRFEYLHLGIQDTLREENQDYIDYPNLPPLNELD